MSSESGASEKINCDCGIPLLEDNGSCSRCLRELSPQRLAQLKGKVSEGLQASFECAGCKTLMERGQNFCVNCGRPAKLSSSTFDSTQAVVCNRCEADLVHGQKFCGNCGIEIEWSGSSDSKESGAPRLKVEKSEETSHTKSLAVTFDGKSPTRRIWSIVGVVAVAFLILGFVMRGTSSSIVSSNDVLSKPALEYIVPSEASQTLQQIWGVELNSSSGPISLRDMADQAFDYLSSSVGGGITKSDVEISFLQGNSMYIFFNRLLNSQIAVKAVKARWIALAD